MFIPKKEKFILILEAIIYVLLIVLASYLTVAGNLFLRMVPMIYILGIFGIMVFNKPIVTAFLSTISTSIFAILIEKGFNLNIITYVIYSAFMITCGCVTGHILDLLYENFKLRKFIKHYKKIIYILVLIVCIAIPLILNNLVNSNMIKYSIARKNIQKYINENYAYTSYFVKNIVFEPSYSGGIYRFDVVIDGIDVELTYSNKEKVSDISMNERKEIFDKAVSAEINILLKENNLTGLNVDCRYEYSKVSKIPDVIKMNIVDTKVAELDDVISFLNVIYNWNKFDLIDRIDIIVDGINVSVGKNQIKEKNITKDYILNGMKYEVLDSKEGI